MSQCQPHSLSSGCSQQLMGRYMLWKVRALTLTGAAQGIMHYLLYMCKLTAIPWTSSRPKNISFFPPLSVYTYHSHIIKSVLHFIHKLGSCFAEQHANRFLSVLLLGRIWGGWVGGPGQLDCCISKTRPRTNLITLGQQAAKTGLLKNKSVRPWLLSTVH